MKNIKKVIKILKISGIELTTINIILATTGSYLMNFDTPPSLSSNARFGKFLKKNSSTLGISYHGSKKVNIRGNITTTGVWS